MKLYELHPGIKDYFDSDYYWYSKAALSIGNEFLACSSKSRVYLRIPKLDTRTLNVPTSSSSLDLGNVRCEVEKLGETDIMILASYIPDWGRSSGHKYVIGFVKNEDGSRIVNSFSFDAVKHNMKIVHDHLLKDHKRGDAYQFIAGISKDSGEMLERTVAPKGIWFLPDASFPMTRGLYTGLLREIPYTSRFNDLPGKAEDYLTDPIKFDDWTPGTCFPDLERHSWFNSVLGQGETKIDLGGTYDHYWGKGMRASAAKSIF